MESDPHNSIVAAACVLLKNIACEEVTPIAHTFSPPRPLRISVRSSISKQLLESGCTTRSVEQLDRLFSITCTALLDACSKHYEATVSRLWALSPEDNNRRKEWDSSVRTAFERKYETGVEAYCQVILQQVRAARLRHSTSPSPPPAPTTDAATTTLSGHFTPAITALLQSAYDAHATGALPNKGERRELARATGLTEKQVVTWVSGHVCLEA